MIKGSSVEANDIQKRFARAKLYESPDKRMIISRDGSQCYFRVVEGKKDVFVRHDILIGRYNVLNAACTEFIPAPTNKIYTPDTSRPFTRDNLLRDPTLVERGMNLAQKNVPGSIVGAGGAALASAAFVLLATPLGPPAAAAASLAGAKVVAGGHVVATVAAAHPIATAVVAGATSSAASASADNAMFPAPRPPEEEE